MDDQPREQTKLSPEASIGTRLEQACDAFEAQFNAGKRPRIEDYLAGVADCERWTFLRELMLLDLDYRSQAGESDVTPQGYIGRFPEFADLIATVFDKPQAVTPALTKVRDYQLLKTIGRGGMGVVYKARHTGLGKIRALKVLPQHFLDNKEAVERFRLEVEHSGRLEHPNIVQALDAGKDRGIHYLVMEFVDGCNLEELVKQEGRLSVGAACEMVRQTAVGLQHAHELFLVHRDIKPSNVMLSKSGQIKILDLGLARLVAEQQTATGITQDARPMGTMDYMAPEQWEDARQVDIRADLYSLGCTLYYLLTGKVPFGGEKINSIWKKQRAHREAPIPSLLDERSDVPQALQDVLARMMAKDAADRYATPAEVIRAVGPFADPQQVRSLPEVETKRGGGPGQLTAPAVSSSFSDTRPRRSTASPPRPRWYRRRVFQASAAAALVFVLLGVMIPLLSGGRDPAIESLRAELGAMPGLHGEPWFEEVPWFTPRVRQALIEAVDHGEAALDGVSLSALSQLVRSSNVASLYRELKTIASYLRNNELPENDETRRLRQLARLHLNDKNYLDNLNEIVEEMQLSDDPSATELHLRAVIEHKLRRWEEAQQSYEQAMKRYDDTGARVLSALCAADCARMWIDRDKPFESSAYTEKARASVACPSLQIVVRCLEADAYRKKSNCKEAAKAVDRAEQVAGVAEDHPLRAYVMERRGWVQMDSWRFAAALSSFKNALKRREACGETPGVDTEKLVLWTRQGIAMAYHFLGDDDAASKEYTEVSDEIPDAFAGFSNQAERRKSQRGPNVYERHAECHLFGAAVNYDQAVDLFYKGIRHADDLGFTRNSKAPYILRMYYKLELARTLAGKRPVENDALSKLGPIVADLKKREADFDGGEAEEHFACARDVSEAVAKLDSPQSADQRQGVDQILAVVGRYGDAGQSEKEITRQNVELLLVAIERACGSGLLSETELGRISHKLIKIAHFAMQGNDPGVQTYLRRYLLAANEALDRSGHVPDDDRLRKGLRELLQSSDG